MRIYTKKGDKGKTYYKSGYIDKSDEVIEALGALDEAQAWCGLLIEHLGDNHKPIHQLKHTVQTLYHINGHIYLDTPTDALKVQIASLEQEIDALMFNKEIKEFVRPTGSIEISTAHIVRTVVRRAERALTKITKDQNIISYINRLSDYLFAIAIYLGGKKYERNNHNLSV
jgi:cob(I)alamin adenosyltransferase